MANRRKKPRYYAVRKEGFDYYAEMVADDYW
jgi:hypothetical protein